MSYPHLHNDEHDLAHIEGVPPVVVRDVSIVLPHCQYPATKGLWKNGALFRVVKVAANMLVHNVDKGYKTTTGAI